MSELRQDPFTDRWVVIAKNRAERPQEFTQVQSRRNATDCPFCRGNEVETPTEIARYRAPGESQDDWQVRVVPNKFPAVRLTTDRNAEEGVGGNGNEDFITGPLYGEGVGGLGQRQLAVGVHEVIIESPKHVASFSELTDLQAELSFLAYRDRLLSLQADPRLAYGMVFKNAGVDAGASLEHVHSQLIALPWIPPEVQYELTKANEYAALHGVGMMTAILDEEVSDGRRLIANSDNFTVFCPAASRLPFETWIVPRRPAPQFECEPDFILTEAARLVRDTIVRFEKIVNRPAYNYWLHSAPLRDATGRIHWRIEVAPRLARLAGFEIGSGCFINPVAPEDAAACLR